MLTLFYAHAGPKFKSSTNEKAAARFCIPHDVVLKDGDINTKPITIEDVTDSVVETDSDSDEDIPIAQLLQANSGSEDDIPLAQIVAAERQASLDPPMAEGAKGAEIATDFGVPHGVCIGFVTESMKKRAGIR